MKRSHSSSLARPPLLSMAGSPASLTLHSTDVGRWPAESVSAHCCRSGMGITKPTTKNKYEPTQDQVGSYLSSSQARVRRAVFPPL